MKKTALFFTPILFLAACGEETEPENLSPEDILEQALATYENKGDIYYRQTLERREEVNGVEETEMRELRFWQFEQSDGQVMERREITEDNEPTEYYVTDTESGGVLFYREGSDTASIHEREEGPIHTRSDDIRRMMESDSAELAGVEEVNGFEAYRLTFSDEEEILDYWFEVNEFYIVREETKGSDPYVLAEVLEFDLDPDYDESLFDMDSLLGEDVEVFK
ncbi:hypothetical protein JSY36_05670 [Bacillus sp. H-16]|uniref:hypothetical protein n=1 Tax=Alteribacter salitolerans TaxID=2912333 RepID=UPI001963394D|nr:hypothetical protein [Alteribacter salitolerans]MBM7095239.1 hypothetical protein [Alteribacter salitolerans]